MTDAAAELGYAGATELLRALEGRELSSVEALDHLLDRIGRVGGPVNAFVTIDAERARQQARAADAERAQGRIRGPLHGLPISIKDCLETAGLRTTAGSPLLRDHVPAHDADAVARLRAAGAVIFGKTNVPTFTADGQAYNEVAGTTNNPWDLSRTPGGSSGGAAAALAAGLTPLELGSDISGSVRIPAAFCGVHGLKPSYGIIPVRGHIPGPPGTLAPADMNVVGPLARSVDDLELALDVLAGPERADARAWRLELPVARAGALRDLRLRVWLDDPACPVASDALTVLQRAIDRLSDAGAAIDEGPPPVPLADSIRVHRMLLKGVASGGLTDEQHTALSALAAAAALEDDHVRVRHARWLTMSKRDWNHVNEERHRARALWAAFFEGYDAFLSPTVLCAAIPHDHSPGLEERVIEVDGQEREYWEQVCWIAPASAAGLPAVSLPAGNTEAGLPIGLQVTGPYLEDRTVLAATRAIDRELGGFQAPPQFGAA